MRILLSCILLFGSAAWLPGQTVASALDEMIRAEMKNQSLPALSIALIDDQKVIWAKGFGYADPAAKLEASPETIYRVGSVSKLFTDIAIMQLVEQNKLNLDAPVSQYLPSFQPNNPFGKPITLREILSHRSGLVREPPIGHYFDSTNPTLKATVDSLNQTRLIYPPGTHTKYSNAAIAAAGYLLQEQVRQAFPDYLKQAVLKPLGMNDSSFVPTLEARARLAHAVIETYDGRILDAPTFELGMAPAGCMYSSVLDLSKFVSMLFAQGAGEQGHLLMPQTLAKMFEPQFPPEPGSRSFGIGFVVDKLDNHQLVGHGGAIYGFATELEALPNEKLGVVVITTSDSANPVVTKIAHFALKLALAEKAGASLPKSEVTESVPPGLARMADSTYGPGVDALDLMEENGTLSLLAAKGGNKVTLRLQGDRLISDGRQGYGQELQLFHNSAKLGSQVMERLPDKIPPPPSPGWRTLVGEYGWDYDTLYILEKGGKLTCLIEWYEYEPLRELSTDQYAYPKRGLYDGETLTFKRDHAGRVTGVQVGAVFFPRRAVGPAEGNIFRIKPLKPVPTLRTEALAQSPPKEEEHFKQPDLVELNALDTSIKLDIRYAGIDNFLSAPVYLQARAFMQRPAAEAVVRANKELKQQGFGVLIHDSYRPWYVTKMFWEGTPQEGRIFVADPAQGSRHNRGCAVDLTMYDRATGKPVEMVGVYDEMSPRSYPFYPGGTSRQRWLRALLRHTMEKQGFTVYETEWWHFDFNDWRNYPILNQTFEQLDASVKPR